VAVGEQISSGMQATKVVTLVRIDPLRLSLIVPQQDIGRIQPGQTVRFRVDSFPDRVFNAKVRFIAPVVTNDTRSMVVEAVAPNPDHNLRPGLFATAELDLSRQQPCVLAPVGAVLKKDEVGRVFVVRDGFAREQVVALGDVAGGKIEIPLRADRQGVCWLPIRQRRMTETQFVHESTCRPLRPPSRLRHGLDPGVGRFWSLRIPEARPRPVFLRSISRSSR